MEDRPGLHRSVLKLSAAIAGVDWCLLIVAMLVRVPREERLGPLLVAAVGWPLVYVMWAGMCHLVASQAGTVDITAIRGPAKDLQLKLLRGPMVLWSNMVLVIATGAVGIVAVLGLLGVLPTK